MKPKRPLFSQEDETLPMPPKGHAHARLDVDLSEQIEKALRARMLYNHWVNRSTAILVAALLTIPAQLLFSREVLKAVFVVFLVLWIINTLYYIWQGRK